MVFYIGDKIDLTNIAKIKHSRIKDSLQYLKIPISQWEDCSLDFCRTEIFRRTKLMLYYVDIIIKWQLSLTLHCFKY